MHTPANVRPNHDRRAQNAAWRLGRGAALCASLLLSPSITPAATPDPAPSGHWRFVRLEEKRPPMTSQDPDVKRSGRARDVTLSCTKLIRIPDPPYEAKQTLSGRWIWDAPPQALIPGRVAAVRVKGSILVNSHRNKGDAMASELCVRWGWTGSDYFKEKRDNRQYSHAALAVHDGSSVDEMLSVSTGDVGLNLSREIPPGTDGQTECPICVSVKWGNDLVDYLYVYAWQTGPPPPGAGPTPGDTASPGTASSLRATSPPDIASPPGAASPPGTSPTTATDADTPQGTQRSSGRQKSIGFAAGTGTPPPPQLAGLVADTKTVLSGGTVVIAIRSVEIPGLGSLNFTLAYDPKVVTVETADKGDLLTRVGAQFRANTKENGLVRFGFAAKAAVAGTGPVAQLQCKAIGNPGDISPLKLAEVMATDTAGNDLTLPSHNGQITIVKEEQVVIGDANKDGKLNLLDAMDALSMSVRLIPEDLKADVDNNGRVTAEDARRILLMVVGE